VLHYASVSLNMNMSLYLNQENECLFQICLKYDGEPAVQEIQTTACANSFCTLLYVRGFYFQEYILWHINEDTSTRCRLWPLVFFHTFSEFCQCVKRKKKRNLYFVLTRKLCFTVVIHVVQLWRNYDPPVFQCGNKNIYLLQSVSTAENNTTLSYKSGCIHMFRSNRTVINC
jgi:hypothetical protein